MSDSLWCDITVENADELVSFYEAEIPVRIDNYPLSES